LTCESCKAFFRRNAIREEEIKCPFSSNCEITPASRRFCQACRLQKCFAVSALSSSLKRLLTI
uniref:Nuclear receptor domain-containing protein n=1 Tax=Haemonchus placei TaxID=6290 RepID=A0A0N4WJ59_HAEPC